MASRSVSLYGEIQKREEIPSFEDCFRAFYPAPKDGLFLGLCEDGLPFMANISFSPCNILIHGDFPFEDIIEFRRRYPPGSGTDYEFVSITRSDLYKNIGGDKILALGAWIHAGNRRPMVVFIEDFSEVFKQDFDVVQNMGWILGHSVAASVTIIAATSKPVEWEGAHIYKTGRRKYSSVDSNGIECVFYVPEDK